jgi:hypothetical protein
MDEAGGGQLTAPHHDGVTERFGLFHTPLSRSGKSNDHLDFAMYFFMMAPGVY